MFCDFCETNHSSNSCYHPGKIKLDAERSRVVEVEKALLESFKGSQCGNCGHIKYHVPCEHCHLSDLRGENERLREALLEFGVHDKECILSQLQCGRPKEGGGYESCFGYGKEQKWYDSEDLPKCQCGFSEALSDKKDGGV